MLCMGRSARRLRKMGPADLVDKRPGYVQLMKDGHSNRGSEMARHAEVTAALGTLVYFCDPASPWQRASNENANGLLRQYFRKGADLSEVEQAEVRFAADEISGRPRAVLEWDSATVRFASLQALAALQATAVSAATEHAVPLPTTGDNPHGLSTATTARELPQWLPTSAVDNLN